MNKQYKQQIGKGVYWIIRPQGAGFISYFLSMVGVRSKVDVTALQIRDRLVVFMEQI